MKNAGTVIPFVFFSVLLVIGLVIHDDYGISWDEPWQHENAEISAEYVNTWFPFTSKQISDVDLLHHWNRHHGVLFTLPVYFLERAFGYEMEEDFRKIFLLRHQLVFLIFWCACILFFKVAQKRFKNWKWALLLTSFLVLSPRIFAHAFFNPKDIVFLFLYLFALYSLLRLLEKRTLASAALLALSCALATDMRIGGFVVTLLSLFFIVLDLVNHRFKPELTKQYGKVLLVFLPCVFCFTIVFWPYLWLQPLVAFQKAFTAMSDYAWDGAILMMGELVPSKHLPWYYIPVWLVVTTPFLYTILFIGGLCYTLWRFGSLLLKGKWYKTPAMRQDFVILTLFLAPLIAVIYKQSVLYDGWRHLYFIYPCFLLLGGVFLRKCHDWLPSENLSVRFRKSRMVLVLVVSFHIVYTLYYMIKSHPHQNVYFTEFMQSKSQLMCYELDYWGLVYKQGFEQLAEIESRYPLKVAVYNQPGKYNWKFLKPGLKYKFEIVDEVREADYFLSNFRNWHDGLEKYKKREYPYNYEEVDSIMVGKTKILGIYKVNVARN